MIGVYYRVSMAKQSTASQESEVAEFVKKNYPISVVKYYEDTGSGNAPLEKRPGFCRLIRDAREAKISRVVVYRLDRFSRNASVAIRIVLELEALGCEFVSVSQPALCLERATPFRKTLLAAFAEIAQLEREAIVERIRAGLKVAAANGKRLGKVGKCSPGQFRKIEELRKLGYTFSEIAKEVGLSSATVFGLVGRKTKHAQNLAALLAEEPLEPPPVPGAEAG